MKIFKLLLADTKCCSHFNLILHTLPKHYLVYRARCTSFVQSGGISQQFVQVVVIVESAEQNALNVCSLVKVSLPCAQVAVQDQTC